MNSTNTRSIDELPKDVIFLIIEFLDEKSRANLTSASKKWRALTTENRFLYRFWKRIPKDGWLFSLTEDCKISEFSMRYQLSVKNPYLHSIGIILSEIKVYEIYFMQPKDPNDLKERFKSAKCEFREIITETQATQIRTVEYDKSLVALKDYLPTQLIEKIKDEILEKHGYIQSLKRVNHSYFG